MWRPIARLYFALSHLTIEFIGTAATHDISFLARHHFAPFAYRLRGHCLPNYARRPAYRFCTACALACRRISHGRAAWSMDYSIFAEPYLSGHGSTGTDQH